MERTYTVPAKIEPDRGDEMRRNFVAAQRAARTFRKIHVRKKLDVIAERMAQAARDRESPRYECAVQRKPYVPPDIRRARREAHPFVVPDFDPANRGARVAAALQGEFPLIGGRFFKLHAAAPSIDDGSIDVSDLGKLSPFSTVQQVLDANAAHRTVKRAHRAARMARKRRRGWA